MRINRVLLGAVMIAALSLGLWLIVSPSIERQANQMKQDELLENIISVIAENESQTLASVLQDTTTDSQETVSSVITPTPIPLDPTEFPDGIIPIGILTIDSIDLILPVMEGVDEPELRIAPGRVPQTAQIGEIGNAVIAGHRNYSFGSMFNRLGEVGLGDVVEFRAMSGELMLFEVFEILEITPENQIAFIQPQNDSIITLYTCTPIRVATHRLLVRAIKIEGGF